MIFKRNRKLRKIKSIFIAVATYWEFPDNALKITGDKCCLILLNIYLWKIRNMYWWLMVAAKTQCNSLWKQKNNTCEYWKLASFKSNTDSQCTFATGGIHLSIYKWFSFNFYKVIWYLWVWGSCFELDMWYSITLSC